MEWKLGSIVKWGIQGGKKYMPPFIQRYKKDNLALFKNLPMEKEENVVEQTGLEPTFFKTETL